MSFLVRSSQNAAVSDSPDDLAALIADHIDVVMLDVDDTLYPQASGLHAAIYERLLGHITRAKAQGLRDELRKEGKMGDGILKAVDLSEIYPHVAQYYRSHGMHDLLQFLTHIYGVPEYGHIAKQPELVAAVDTLRASGKRVVLYSNGAYRLGGHDLHIAKVLHHLGFEPDSFAENDIVDMVKPDRYPSALRFFRFKPPYAVRLFAKPAAAAFQRACKIMNFQPGERVAFFDDGLANLANGKEWGVKRIHVAADEETLKDARLDGQRDYAIWTNRRNEAGQYLSPVAPILAKAAQLLPAPANRKNLGQRPEPRAAID